MHNVTVAFAVLLVMLLSYFFGCFNGSFMVSHFIIRDDVRKHGSGNAGLTNFYRTYGAKYALGVILLDMGKTVANPPLIFNVNWFRKDKDGNFIWPGYGDNMRVLDWILRRAKGKAEGQKTVLGVSPTYAELDKTGLDNSSTPTWLSTRANGRRNWKARPSCSTRWARSSRPNWKNSASFSSRASPKEPHLREIS